MKTVFESDPCQRPSATAPPAYTEAFESWSKGTTPDFGTSKTTGSVHPEAEKAPARLKTIKATMHSEIVDRSTACSEVFASREEVDESMATPAVVPSYNDMTTIFDADTFDLHRAVIETEILNPKFLQF